MPDLNTLLSDREKLAKRLEAIENGLAELRLDVAQADEEIKMAKRHRLAMVTRGRRMFALLQECKSELCRYDALIKQTVDAIADNHIGEREGAYLIPGGMVIARTRINGNLYTAFVELLDSS
jgi:hypothetical protein